MAAALICVAMVVVTACGAGGNDGTGVSIDPNHPYAAEFRRNYDEVTAPIAKGILEDGKFTEAEMSDGARN